MLMMRKLERARYSTAAAGCDQPSKREGWWRGGGRAKRGSEGKRKGEKERRQMFHTGTWEGGLRLALKYPPEKCWGRRRQVWPCVFRALAARRLPSLPLCPLSLHDDRSGLCKISGSAPPPPHPPPPRALSPTPLYFSRKLLHSHSAQGRGTEPHHRAPLGLYFAPFLGRDPAHPTPSHPTHLASSNHPPPFLQCCRVSPYWAPHSSQYFPGFPQLSGQRSNLCAPLSVSSPIPPGWMSGREGDPTCGLLEEVLMFLSLRVPPGVLGPGGEGPVPGALSSLSLGRMTFTKGSSCSWFSKGEIRAHDWKDIGQGVRDRGSNTSSATNWLGGFGQPFCDMRGTDLWAPAQHLQFRRAEAPTYCLVRSKFDIGCPAALPRRK